MVRYDNEWPEEPRRRWWRALFSAPVVAVLAILTTAGVGLLVYYYVVFSARIDRLLRGEIFTRSAGIYAAPKEVRAGEALSIDELVARLKRAGYVERAQQADSSRGRYAINGSAVEIEPSENSVVDGKRVFARLRVQFARNGKGITAITDLDNDQRVNRAWLEPE